MTHHRPDRSELDPEFLAALPNRPHESSTTYSGASLGGGTGFGVHAGVARTREAVPMPKTPAALTTPVKWAGAAIVVSLILVIVLPPLGLVLFLAADIWMIVRLVKIQNWKRATKRAVEAHLGWDQFGRAA
ncbi:hypothetical protein [Nocardia sp. NPDC046763]|uniref:hypothetical protein n=1 Tax=Nocardia sp. NPDC046763 TaxID=3155256 RepID=UPI0033E40A5B